MGQDDVRFERVELSGEGARASITGTVAQFADPQADVVLRGRRLRRLPGDHHPDGPGELPLRRRLLRHPECDATFVDEWLEMYNRTIAEDCGAVLVQQPGLRSRMVPHGRLMVGSESSIAHFHRLVWRAIADALEAD